MAIGNLTESWLEADAVELEFQVDACIRHAQAGDPHALGDLYEQCKRYLLLIANRELDDQLQAKFGASDIVQETMLKAQCGMDRFAGSSQGELLAWLRVILLNTTRDMARRYQQGSKRDVRRERELRSLLSEETATTQAGPHESPSRIMMAGEEAAVLRQALDRLPADYRQVIGLRNIERMPFDEIGLRMGRSGDAARKLWVRALDQLRTLLGASNDPV